MHFYFGRICGHQVRPCTAEGDTGPFTSGGFPGHQKTPFWKRVSKIHVRNTTFHRKTYFYLIPEGGGFGGFFLAGSSGEGFGGEISMSSHDGDDGVVVLFLFRFCF